MNTRKRPHVSTRKDDEIDTYSDAFGIAHANMCCILRHEIDRALPGSTSRIWHAIPVWFINGNPVVGYNKAGNNISLLFWNGQAFNEAELKPAGKFKAARIQYANASNMNLTNLRRWLKKAKQDVWDYTGLRSGTAC